jgi:hypothetical protein
MHAKLFAEKVDSEIDVPPDMMSQIIPGLEKLVFENRLHVDSAQAIILSHKVPLEIAQLLGLVAHSSTTIQQQQQGFSQSASPLNNINSYQSPTDHMNNMHHFHGINFNYPTPAGTLRNHEPSHCSSLNTSPMHQITRGISGLTTNSNEPLDLTMDSSSNNDMETTQWNIPQNFYDIRPLNLSSTGNSSQIQQQQQRMMQPTPPTSPSNNLCIIQEEHLTPQYQVLPCDLSAQHNHPQISLTDVQGSEITLVALSDSSRGSDDSLDTNNSNDTSRRTASTVTTPGTSSGIKGISMFHEFLIKEPSDDMPSITRGVGRKASLENEYNKHQPAMATNSMPVGMKIDAVAEQYARRGSDKSLGFSDDSLSNDSNQSPAQEVSHSSGFKSTEEERLSPDSLSESRASSDEYYELPLPSECKNLDVPSIMEIVRQQIINSKIPPNRIKRNDGEGANQQFFNSPEEVSNMSLEYSSGLQIELKICERQQANEKQAGTSATSENAASSSKGIIKLRRISGDSTEYGKLCQQLLTQLTV